ncbi:MAG: 4Fe-4S binding protein [Chitinispirillales bacterium]|jgi:ferredoxin|nr:4Fe-4S binding protein [Chitinispirillales bacterium]
MIFLNSEQVLRKTELLLRKFFGNESALQAVASILRKYSFFLILLSVTAADAQSRFPRPEFQSGYESPETNFGIIRSVVYYYIDVAVLLAALCAAAYFVLKKRSRKGIFALTVLSLAYFGFYKKGCVCSIGAIQNVTASAFSGYAIPLTSALFFLLPLLFSLFFGRVYCSSVCPLGAVQELVILKPKRLPRRLSAVLGFIPHIYLGLAVLFAATGAGFIICRFDPFVGIFRLGAPLGMIIFGTSLLVIGTVVARPYCRFLCPYGVLLGLTSLVSKWTVRISPGACINCRLCENACPVDAIQLPSTEPVREQRSRSVGRLKVFLILFPLWIAAGSFTGWLLSDLVSARHPQVKLLRGIEANENSGSSAQSLEREGLRINDEVIAILNSQAASAQKKTKTGMILLGAYLGTVTGIYLIRQSIRKKRIEYSADPSSCISCGRCYKYCPKNKPPRVSPKQQLSQEERLALGSQQRQVI